jgi:zinc transport system ATP-binding protein
LALLEDPDLLVLDEPGTGVDIRGGQLMCEVLDGLRRARGFTQLMVSHDLGLVRAHASHVICLNRTVLAEGAPEHALRPEIIQAAFGPHRYADLASAQHGPECEH